MTDEQKKNNSLLNRLIVYKGTSDDLIFWVLTDVLFLSSVKGFTDVQISMLFTGGFWGSLILSYPYFRIIKKLRIQTGMILNQTLLLIASLMLLLSRSIVTMMIAQCIYYVAVDSFGIAEIFIHDLCRKSAGKRDFVKCTSRSASLYGVLSMIFALQIYPLMQINGSLPMILGACMTVYSLVFVILIARDSKDMVPFQKESPEIQEKKTGFGRLTWIYIVLAVFTSTFLAVSLTNLKILLNDNITMVYGAGRAVALFSGMIIVTRAAKILGNVIPDLVQKKVRKYQGVAVGVTGTALIAMVLILLSFSFPQSSAVLVGIGITIVYMMFDPLCNITHYLFVNGLSEQQELSAIFTVTLAGNVLQAVLSSIVTLLLARGAMHGVMQLLTAVAVLAVIISILGLCVYRRTKKAARENKNA